MRRSAQSSLLSAFASFSLVDRHRISQRLMWLTLALALGLGVLSGTVGSALASGSGNAQLGPALAQGNGYEMRAYVANCQIVPPLPPTLNEAGCAPAVGAYVEFVADDGASWGCTTNEVLPDGTAAGCSVIVPYNTNGQAYLDLSTIAPGFAPRYNPIGFSSPGPGPIDGIVGFPIFVNLPDGTGQTDQSEQTQPVEPVEQVQPATPADRYATVISGTCAEPGDDVDESIGVYTPRGDRLGLPTALIAESGGGSIGVALDDLFASLHAIVVVTPADGQGDQVACGDLGTVADDDGVAVIGLHPAQGSEMAGIAYLATDQNTGRTLVSIFLSEGLG